MNIRDLLKEHIEESDTQKVAVFYILENRTIKKTVVDKESVEDFYNMIEANFYVTLEAIEVFNTRYTLPKLVSKFGMYSAADM